MNSDNDVSQKTGSTHGMTDTAPGAIVTLVAAVVLGLRQPVDDEGVDV